MPHMWGNRMHAGVCPACGYRSNREDLSSGMAYWCEPMGSQSVPCWQENGQCHIPVFRTHYQDYNYDFTRFFYLTTTPYKYLMTFIQITYIIRFILIPNSLAETVNP